MPLGILQPDYRCSCVGRHSCSTSRSARSALARLTSSGSSAGAKGTDDVIDSAVEVDGVCVLRELVGKDGIPLHFGVSPPPIDIAMRPCDYLVS